MPASPVSQLIEKIRKRRLNDGGFPDNENGVYRPDATAWAVLALKAAGVNPEIIESARSRLLKSQLKDGRIPVSSDHPETFWPTPLVILAWQEVENYRPAIQLSSRFLLDTTGIHWKKKPGDPSKHDTALRGWPWIEKTHSWIEPTCLTVIALEISGFKDHERVREAVKMILDRQLPKGGWNYGNTLVFDAELEPFPDTTGLALSALADLVARPEIDRSLVYLNNKVKNTKTPISLGWSLLGLSAWMERPSGFNTMILESMSMEKKFGTYSTTAYSLLVLSLLASSGIKNLIRNAGKLA